MTSYLIVGAFLSQNIRLLYFSWSKKKKRKLDCLSLASLEVLKCVSIYHKNSVNYKLELLLRNVYH